ncbi:histidine kinase [Streptomyces sp. NPDC097640]|uniref:histidine kinase n=1 Tax=Streptomyces sp. NPDC097640 TaxID=3157229 RepID=UPI00332317A7
MINVQAGVALHLGERTPTLATESLRSIRDGSQQALDELRTMVGLLSRPGAVTASPSVAPQRSDSRPTAAAVERQRPGPALPGRAVCALDTAFAPGS